LGAGALPWPIDRADSHRVVALICLAVELRQPIVECDVPRTLLVCAEIGDLLVEKRISTDQQFNATQVDTALGFHDNFVACGGMVLESLHEFLASRLRSVELDNCVVLLQAGLIGVLSSLDIRHSRDLVAYTVDHSQPEPRLLEE
jgi:hypothetical protein